MHHFVAAALRCAGVLPVATLLARRSPRILMYHRFDEQPGGLWPDAAMFERQVRYLQSKFRVVSLTELTDSLAAGRPHRNAVVLTIDDGYEDFYRIAYPVLKAYGVPATLYVTTDFIDGRTWLWPDIVAYILQRTPHERWTSNGHVPRRTYDLTNSTERRAAWSHIGLGCIELDVAERTALLQRLAQDLDVQVPPKPTDQFRPLSWAQVCEMSANGIEIGSHSCSHPRLTLCSPAELEHEACDSKRGIEQAIGRHVTSFCYPFGKHADVNSAVKRAVIAAGYRNAVVAYADAAPADELFELRRFGVGPDFEQFRRVASGASALSVKLRRLSLVANRRAGNAAQNTDRPSS